MKWTISKKILGGFSIVITVLIVIIGVGYYQLNNVDNNYTFLIQDKAKKAVDIKDLQIAVKQEIVTLRGYLVLDDEESLENFNKATDDFQKKYNSMMEIFEIPEAIKMLEELKKIEVEYQQFAAQVFELKRQDKISEVEALVATRGREIGQKFDEQAEKLSAYQNEILDKGNKETSNIAANTKKQILVLGILSVLISIGIAVFIGRLISRPVMKMANQASKIASGDLTVDEIKVKNKDEIGDLADSFNQMTRNLKILIEKIRLDSEQVASSAEELTAAAEQTTQATNHISTSIQEVANGAEIQGHGVNESSIAMKDMAQKIQQMAETTSSISELATETNGEARNGRYSLQKVTEQMNTIREFVDESASVINSLGVHSQEIGKIIDVITSIADQTNLLALNAAIEAARAGEYGKGFAVVADEVRKLAEQSKESADQITELIQKIQGDATTATDVMDKGTQEVKEGMLVVHEAEENFEKIQKLIEQVTAQIQEASASSEEMSASVQQVTASIEEIARIAKESSNNTQNIASASEEQLASMEEIVSSASALSKLAEDLQEQASQFKI